ncbi:hypothetical protein BHAOGJBA_6310 [Methylobacterium hispanicum]|uniref:Uncharacterized protein n=1 Tax=Methylobacterium hispanicum TaxID=270350 RepID=A0AAV4ZXC2_9HYPH|nr:hypothetical protein BHAOGJBA_6310 [Methylobacterium hispanicum]
MRVSGAVRNRAPAGIYVPVLFSFRKGREGSVGALDTGVELHEGRPQTVRAVIPRGRGAEPGAYGVAVHAGRGRGRIFPLRLYCARGKQSGKKSL